ncbi:MAG: protein-L-isoaspartate(D-aspartate) O-methyltransferase [Deltaproteobacteria bacterium]|nr:protein-L-isoaspartate(D-aspartate) O-methyltransferase [Deltaproteobacteria bacterium]
MRSLKHFIPANITRLNRIISFVSRERGGVNGKEERLQMVNSQLVKRGIKDERVLEAMGKVPRHLFVPGELRARAYRDGPLSIGEGQTISQPYMVALMTEGLGLNGGETVLEIGTGSGYQTAILAELADTVYTIERITILSEKAQPVLREMGYRNIHFKVSDGTYGWPGRGPFDGIIVTAGAPEISQVLVDQLKEGGILVIPVGSRYSQTLYRVTKKKGNIEKENLTLCIFVPLVGDYGWKENED